MTSRSYVRGRIVSAETAEAVRELRRTARCEHCRRAPTAEGHDGCLGALPGVVAACCGHGRPEDSYVVFGNGTTVYGFNRVVKLPSSELA